MLNNMNNMFYNIHHVMSPTVACCIFLYIMICHVAVIMIAYIIFCSMNPSDMMIFMLVIKHQNNILLLFILPLCYYAMLACFIQYNM